jgi:dUTP pyrophosphatase
MPSRRRWSHGSRRSWRRDRNEAGHGVVDMNMKTTVEIMRLPHGADLPLPAYQSAGAAGLDLHAAVPADAPVTIEPGKWVAIPTGVAIALSEGTEGQVRPRSGLAARSGITLLNAPGTVDADYRGEIHVILVNFGQNPFLVERGSRIAQLVVVPVAQAHLLEVKTLKKTVRGTGGFGSTGTGVIDKSR